MTQTAKVFTTERSQTVRLPLEFRFDEKEVYIRRDPATGDVILSRRPDSWAGFFALDATTQVPADFMSQSPRPKGLSLDHNFLQESIIKPMIFVSNDRVE